MSYIMFTSKCIDFFKLDYLIEETVFISSYHISDRCRRIFSSHNVYVFNTSYLYLVLVCIKRYQISLSYLPHRKKIDRRNCLLNFTSCEKKLYVTNSLHVCILSQPIIIQRLSCDQQEDENYFQGVAIGSQSFINHKMFPRISGKNSLSHPVFSSSVLFYKAYRRSHTTPFITLAPNFTHVRMK